MFFLSVMFVNQITTRWLWWVPLAVCGVPILFYALVREKHPRADSATPTPAPTPNSLEPETESRDGGAPNGRSSGTMPGIQEEGTDVEAGQRGGELRAPNVWTTTQRGPSRTDVQPVVPAIHVELA